MTFEPFESPRPKAPLGRRQYSLGALLFFVTVCAIAMSCYRTLGPGMVVFIIGLTALMLFVLRLMGQVRQDSPATIEVGSDAEAHLGCDCLREHGIPAQIAQEQASGAYPLVQRLPTIVVPAEAADRARELLRRLAEGDASGVREE